MLDQLYYQKADEIIAFYGKKPSSLIPVMQDIQGVYRYLPGELLTYIAKEIGVKEAKAYSVATFYENFSFEKKGKYVISGVTGVVRGTLSYDYKVTYQKEDVTVGDMNGTVDGSSQMSAEFVYKDGNYQLRTVNPGSIWYRESQ